MTDRMEQGGSAPPLNDEWRKYLVEGHAVAALLRRTFRMAPASPRCATCFAPFKGIGGKMLSVTGFQQSRKAPRFCKMCCEGQPLGGAEVPTGVLFADMRGYTAMAEHTSPEEVARRLNRFYRVASDVLVRYDALIDKLIGDQVMALFLPGFTGADYITKMVSAAETLVDQLREASKEELSLPVGVGLDHGTAWVGNIGSREVNDFTAVGDVVNTAARLQAEAKPGQVVMSERVYEQVGNSRYPGAIRVVFDLKGKTEPVAARVVEIAVS